MQEPQAVLWWMLAVRVSCADGCHRESCNLSRRDRGEDTASALSAFLLFLFFSSFCTVAIHVILISLSQIDVFWVDFTFPLH